MELRAGSRLKSSVCATEVIVVKAPEVDVDVTCGGVAMTDPAAAPDEPGQAVDGLTDGTALGKRYVNEDESLEVLCTKPGDGTLGIGQTALELKEAKALPASD